MHPATIPPDITPDQRHAAFLVIKAGFDDRDKTIKAAHGAAHFTTSHGIWGASDLEELYQFFVRIHLEARTGFLDLGSGDGRVVFVASLFTRACGVEADERLHAEAARMQESLCAITEYPAARALHAASERCELLHGDFTNPSLLPRLRAFPVVFTFSDHHWPAPFERQLAQESDAVLLSYRTVFRPGTLKKGKTYWVGQTAIESYPFGAITDLDEQ